MEDELQMLYPIRDGEDPMAWTTRVLSHAHEYGTYRQCSIGWHDECSERHLGADAECRCLCHRSEIYTVEGHAEGGVLTVLRAEEGKHYWLAQPDEPETMWAWWVYANSAEEATQRAVRRQK